MYKHSPSRSQRSKGIKVKHILQICLLVALCCWLIYQVKHSHDKKREFDDSAKVSLAAEQKVGVVKLGRKYLNPQMKDKVTKASKQDDDEEEETAVEEEDNKHEEVEEQDDNKIDEKEEEEDIDEERGDGEEIDDHEQEKFDADNDQEVDFVDDEKERENVDEQKLEEEDAEDNKGQTEKDNASREHYKKGGDITNTREAREENYKADDASSAVSHDTQIASTDDQTRIRRKSTLQAEVSELNHPVKTEGGETAKDGSYLAAIATSNATKGPNNLKNISNSTAVRIESGDVDTKEGDKNARKDSKFQSIDNKLEVNSTLLGSNDRHNLSFTINKDPSLEESKKSDGTNSSFSKILSNSANVSGKSEEAFDETKDNKADGNIEKIDESNFETSDDSEVDLIDSSDSTNSSEDNYM